MAERIGLGDIDAVVYTITVCWQGEFNPEREVRQPTAFLGYASSEVGENLLLSRPSMA